ncbi:MAG: ABC transporter permease [Armatimonadetes bacterium]|nr:ABC transporter permease [Armatimonadota bacterium]
MRAALWVFRKEAREIMRDRRVMVGAFITPVFIIILFVVLVGFIEQKVKTSPDLSIVIVGETDNLLVSALEKAEDVTLRYVDSVDEGRELLAKGRARVVLEFSEQFEQELLTGEATITAHYDSSETLSSIAFSAIRGIVNEANKASAKQALERAGLPASLAAPMQVVPSDIAKAEGLGGSMLAGLLPYLIVLWAFYGGFSTVTDLVAGEKERGTMETLLISPISRWQVAFGKFLSLAAICFISSMTTLVAILIVGLMNFELTKAVFPTGVHISASSALSMLAILVPLVLFFAALLISISAYAKNIRESQTYLTVVNFVVLMPVIFSQFIGFTGVENSAWVRWTPILNSAIALREALLSKLTLGHLGSSVGVSLVLAVAMMAVAFYLFNREQILSRS